MARWSAVWGPRPVAVVPVPSRTRPQLIDSMAGHIAQVGRLPLIRAIESVGPRPPHDVAASARARAVESSLRLAGGVALPAGPLLLVDDSYRTGWTATVAAARESGAAILVAPVTDTIKQVSAASVVKTLDRSELRRALTPQCFQYELLRQAYQHADVNDPSLTDECALVEKLGRPVRIIEGSARNIKITTAEDLAIAEQFLAADYTD